MDHPTASQANGLPTVSAEHISITPGVCGGKPCIAGTRIRVQDLYVWHELQGQSADEIVSNFPHLTLGDVYAALAYYWDHRDDMERQRREEEAFVESMKAKIPSPLEEKLRRRNAPNGPVSP
jgi:uncharacterized protein (DUF433 family)